MRDRIQGSISHFRADQRGSVAIIFGFSIFFLCGFMGLAVDASRAYNVAARTQAILDAASLTAAKMLNSAGANDTDVIARAKAVYAANPGAVYGSDDHQSRDYDDGWSV
jgi:Flp pilus assembly protein TadG